MALRQPCNGPATALQQPCDSPGEALWWCPCHAGHVLVALRWLCFNLYYLLEVKNCITLELGGETKLLPDSSFEISLCNTAFMPKSEKHLFFSWPPMPLEIELLPRGWPHRVPSMPKNLEKVQIYPKPVKWATLFRANPFIILLQVNSLILNNLHYIVLALWKTARSAKVKNKIKILVLQ